MSFVPLQELKELTGRKQPSRICKWLAERDWAFEISADGLPRVDRRYFDKRIMRGETDQPPEINQKALDALCDSKIQK